MKPIFLFLFFFLQLFWMRSQSRFTEIDGFILDYFEKFNAEKIDSIHVYSDLNIENNNYYVFKYNSEGKILESRSKIKNNPFRLVEFSYDGNKTCKKDSIFPFEGVYSHKRIVNVSEFYDLFGKIEYVQIKTVEKNESKEYSIIFNYNSEVYSLLDSIVFKGYNVFDECYIIEFYGRDLKNERFNSRFFYNH